MKITIEVDDITTFAKALNNAMVAYGDIIWSLRIGCDVPKYFWPLGSLDEEELDNRFECLQKLYEQVEKIERGM